MNDEAIYADSCPLCLRPLRPEFGRSRESGQQNGPARVWFAGYRCDGCEATRPQQFWDAMSARYAN
ncbi:hypothetical protein ACGFYF_37950 [Streptomyces lavendulae]|uniref:hypothetical protein n=1 Tax=Streptomyces lavendulae TaxID=1914 RepID=UPI00371C2BFB